MRFNVLFGCHMCQVEMEANFKGVKIFRIISMDFLKAVFYVI